MGIKQKLMHYTWNIAYGNYSADVLTNGIGWEDIRYIKNPYQTKWFADPFILEESHEYIQFLVEEFDSSINRGRIARIAIDKNTNVIDECNIILDLDTHLSFPAIYKIGNEIYVHPENSQSGASYIYKYDRTVDKLVEPHLLLNQPLTDAIINKEGDRYIMYATRNPMPNGNILFKYQANNILGPYTEVCNACFSSNTARMAGLFIGNIRPSQDCSRDYGMAVIMYRDNEKICRIKPMGWKYGGIHTFNILNNTFVIDLKSYDYPFLYKMIRLIRK